MPAVDGAPGMEVATPDRPKAAARSKAARLEYIATAVRREGFVYVEDLVAALDVSRMTIHRDFDELQELGTLRKVRGGASAQRSTQYESDLLYRSAAATEEKKRIAAVAADLANDGDVVIIDDSTSALALIPHLVQLDPMTIITNCLPAMQQIGGHPHVNLIGLGGQFVSRYASFLGMMSEDNLTGLFADILFTSTSSLRENVLYHQDQRVVMTKRAMMGAAQRRVLLMDHTKIGQGALYRLGEVAEFTHVVLDDPVDPALVEQLQEQGVTVLTA